MKTRLLLPALALAAACTVQAKKSESEAPLPYKFPHGLHVEASVPCLDCHSPHAGHDKLLVRPSETATCVQCHDRREFNRKTVHAALEEGCTTCHDVHDRDMLALRGAAINDKCADCHDAAKTHAHPTSPEKRDPRTRGPLTCTGCHEPHSSDFEKMLTHVQKRDLCVQCHSAGMEH